MTPDPATRTPAHCQPTSSSWSASSDTFSDHDLWRLIDASPQLCAPGATLLWSRGRDEEDLNPDVRARFAAAGFSERAYETLDADYRIGLGAVRYDGPAVDLVPGQALFTFVR